MKNLLTFENYSVLEFISPKRQVDVALLQDAIHRFKSSMPQILSDISRLPKDIQRDFAHLYLWSLKSKLQRTKASKSIHLNSIEKLQPVLSKYIDTKIHDEDLADAFISALQSSKNMDEKIPVELASEIEDIANRLKS